MRKWGDQPEIKSVSRGMNFRRDLTTEEEIRTGVAVRVDHVAMNLRRHGLKGAVVNVQIKTPELRSISRQVSLDHHTYLQHEIQDIALRLIRDNWPIGERAPIRAITVGVTKLIPENQAGEQTDMFDLLGEAEGKKPKKAKREKQEKLEAAVDAIRQRFGSATITLGYQQNEGIGVIREKPRREE